MWPVFFLFFLLPLNLYFLSPFLCLFVFRLLSRAHKTGQLSNNDSHTHLSGVTSNATLCAPAPQRREGTIRDPIPPTTGVRGQTSFCGRGGPHAQSPQLFSGATPDSALLGNQCVFDTEGHDRFSLLSSCRLAGCKPLRVGASFPSSLLLKKPLGLPTRTSALSPGEDVGPLRPGKAVAGTFSQAYQAGDDVIPIS